MCRQEITGRIPKTVIPLPTNHSDWYTVGMSNIIKITGTHSVEQLQKLIKTSKDEGQKTRLRVILGIQRGKLRKEVAEDLNLNIDTITDTVRRYNNKGVEGLIVSKGGRPEGNPKWDNVIFDDLVKEIDKQEKYWSVPVMMSWIKENKAKDIPYNTVWYHVRNLNYSYKSARPHPHLGDKNKQELFKKGA